MKILITGRLAISLTDPEKRSLYQSYEDIREDLGEIVNGDTVVATYDGYQEIGEVAVNPTQEKIADMQERVMEMSQFMAEADAEDNEGTPENWEDYISEGYPQIVWYKAIIGGEDDAADLEVVDMKELFKMVEE